MNVELIHAMGDDLTIVNTAVVAERRRKQHFQHSDDSFIRQLMLTGELEPFEHPQLQFHITAPIEASHRLRKHSSDTKWSEIGQSQSSIKHLDQQVTFYTPTRERWREKSTDDGVQIAEDTMDKVLDLYERSRQLYQHLVELKHLPPEEAALVLPRSTYTEWAWTASLLQFSKICQTYNHKETNVELKEITKQMSDLINKRFPISWKYLLGAY